MQKALDPSALRTFSNAEFDPERDALDDTCAFKFSETAGQFRSSERLKNVSVIFHPSQRRNYVSTFQIEYGGQITQRITFSGRGSTNEVHDMQLSRLYVKR